jgi:hypothetical protein
VACARPAAAPHCFFLLLLHPTGMSWMEDNHILGFSSLGNVRVLRGINPIDSLPLLSNKKQK